MKKWVKLPSAWIEGGGLTDFRWAKGQGSGNLAALMCLSALAHRMNETTGEVRATYDELQLATSLSRAKVSEGLSVLAERGRIEREPNGRSTFQVCDYFVDRGWAKFPAERMYRNGAIDAFSDFRLRSPAELDAIKLFFLFAARRDNDRNLAMITYDQIGDMTDMSRKGIKRGLSLLAANGLVHIEHIPRLYGGPGIANAYRLSMIDPRHHLGTAGRGITTSDLMDL